ncbi:D-alanine--D-alanine ligase [Rhodococcus sp. 06-412-2C]|uniref:D-alanine--D-alanine ligase family protein n=1 Tax=unclassified Rhodococcus (in: high G+C Gram-positive bacteria) TaxID=192944 RepID=UPI000B9BCA44|nr:MULTISPECIES: D-alanine--D-alanine ligase [unclassified Rhodococcus (in: high G+C Gram-positive bacteria)]OZC84061.1 D-alanine--D-alanine ligase [Rhodococcus sp. 06-412-2C]OZC94248.1 D-alanine--D-alanine ligase [Rhodococcus sp. 06-412-2B]
MALSVLVLIGSSVDEFHCDLSRVYAGGFLDALGDDPAYELEVAFVSPGGLWSFPGGIDSASVAAAPQMSLAQAVEVMSAWHFDVMVPQMFCLPGMTTYRSLFDLMDVPYVGNTPDVMAMTADKALARAVVAAAGVAVPAGVVVRSGGTVDLELPVVVKPVDSDNSMGVTLVEDNDSVASAIRDALAYSSAALVESYIPLGREVRCGIIAVDGELVCLPLEEYAVDSVRTSADKLNRTADGDLYLVAKQQTKAWIVDTADPITEKVWAAARSCYRSLGCRHYGLFDFRIDPDGEPWFLEAGLYCSYSPSSVLAVMAAAADITIDRLFAHSLRELSVKELAS